ncbi:PREDICTED: uncharacterized protein LOC109243018 [Nicotiana attenuata]|uniref:uncharacterized protein LOC109243018 n=1 Tax=Nicotiana attenuata TaxID=49451 RepID=UPI000904F1CF|nr:PREDICTED: uncharacterized protein LOC109243018 [Nicotiana attenuata]
MCRMSTIENEPFTILEKIPLELHMWWNDLGEVSRGTAIKALGGLIGLLKIKPRLDIIEALVPFWDPTHNVFHIFDFVLTPTLEEIAGYAGFSGNLRNWYPVAPRVVTPHKFLDLLSISWELKVGNLADGFCTFYFLYRRYGDPHGFEAPDTGLTHSGNKGKWEARWGLAFIVAFMGILICPRKDGHIELGLVGTADFMIKKANGTIVPMILAEIYRALTVCRAGGNFFEGCNMLLQLWMEEHLCHHPGYMNYGMTGLNCIEEHENRIEGHEFSEGTEAWFAHLSSLTANKIEWTFGWLPVTKVIYMSAEACFLLLMGLQSIQPYAPHTVLRQLGRYQTIPHDEDLSRQVIELGPKAAFPEEKVRQIWHQCRFLEPKTRVRDLSKGELEPSYTTWYGKRFQVHQEPERPSKRPHVQQFDDGAQEQRDCVQAAADEGEKKKLAQENKALRAQIQKMKVAAEIQERSRTDERLINGLRRKISEYEDDLEKCEGSLARARAQLEKNVEGRAEFVRQLKRKYDGEVTNLKKKLTTSENKMAKQTMNFKAEREHCYALMSQLEEDMQ